METGVSIESPIGALSTIEPRIAAKGATKSSGAVVTHIAANMVAIAKMFFIAVFIVDILFILQRVRCQTILDWKTALNDIRPASYVVRTKFFPLHPGGTHSVDILQTPSRVIIAHSVSFMPKRHRVR